MPRDTASVLPYLLYLHGMPRLPLGTLDAAAAAAASLQALAAVLVARGHCC